MEGKIRSRGEAVGVNHGKRLIGLDILKILACYGVVAIHTINPTYGIVNRIIQLFTVFAVPVFFTINGFLILKKDVTYKYILNKIAKILLVTFIWEILLTVMWFAFYREIRPFWKSWPMDFIQWGTFFQFWFLGSLIIIYLAAPLIKKLLNKSKKAYFSILILLFAVCAVLNVVQCFFQVQFTDNVIQTFKLWIWLFYFMAGGALAVYYNECLKLYKKHKPIILISAFLLIIVSFIWMLFCKGIFGRLHVGGYYDAATVTLSIVLIVFLSTRINRLPARLVSMIGLLSKCSMGVYIIHAILLELVTKFFPIFAQESSLWNVLYWLFVSLISTLIIIVIYKTKILRYIISL